MIAVTSSKRRQRPRSSPYPGQVLRNDDGYATIVATGIIVAVVSLTVVIAAVAGRTVDTHRAQTAADLAAVAGAIALNTGGSSGEACAVAGDTAGLNNAEVISCDIDGRDVVVTAESGRSQATARAGPL